MDKFIVIPDSFKGTMSSNEICDIMKSTILRYYPAAEVVMVPVADGGEGSVDCFLQALGGQKINVMVQGPFGEQVEGFYGLLDNGKTAVIEMAAAAGLPQAEGRLNPLTASTYGVGQLVADAVGRGVSKVIMGLGGSATNDVGCGAAAAIGVQFTDKAGNEFVPTGGTLGEIAHISLENRLKGIENVEFVAMCDIDNPMYGEQGAAYIFGPQKGATPETVVLLDDGVKHVAEVIKKDIGMDLAQVPGTGAAGAMGAGMLAFFGAHLQMGIETVLDTVDFDNLLKGTSLVLTGEGKIDGQSLRGKVVVGVARRAQRQDVPVVAIVGDIGDNVAPVYDEGVSGIFSINRLAIDFKEAKHHAKEDLQLTVDNLMRFLQRIKK